MLLLIDAGNTNITLGVCNETEILRQWRLTTGFSRTTDEMGMDLIRLLEHARYKAEEIDGVIICSVVPKLTYSLIRAVRLYFNTDPVIVSRSLELGLKLLIPAAGAIGADRLVDCAAAYKLYGGPVVVCDFGTATTYDVLLEDGEFITGITSPGIRISADALFGKASQISEIELALPESIIAKDPVESLQCGILYGCIGQTEYIVSRLKRELNIPNAVVVATGGLSRLIAMGTDIFTYNEPNLTLEGLRIIYAMNPRAAARWNAQ